MTMDIWIDNQPCICDPSTRAAAGEKETELGVFCLRCRKSRTLKPGEVAPTRRKSHFLQSTTDTIPGYDVLEHKGLVVAAVSTMLFGKLINKQEDRLAHAAEKALAEVSAKAAGLGANAVVGIRMTANNVEGGVMASNSTGVLASGTAVLVVARPNPE